MALGDKVLFIMSCKLAAVPRQAPRWHDAELLSRPSNNPEVQCVVASEMCCMRLLRLCNGGAPAWLHHRPRS